MSAAWPWSGMPATIADCHSLRPRSRTPVEGRRLYESKVSASTGHLLCGERYSPADLQVLLVRVTDQVPLVFQLLQSLVADIDRMFFAAVETTLNQVYLLVYASFDAFVFRYCCPDVFAEYTQISSKTGHDSRLLVMLRHLSLAAFIRWTLIWIK